MKTKKLKESVFVARLFGIDNNQISHKIMEGIFNTYKINTWILINSNSIDIMADKINQKEINNTRHFINGLLYGSGIYFVFDTKLPE
jgi:uncharacterized membrane protein